MKRMLTALALAACFVGAPATARTADAYWNDAPTYHHEYRYHSGYDHAWRVVRRDPCRYAAYRHFAARHQNPVKRRRYVEQLAYQGCPRTVAPGYHG